MGSSLPNTESLSFAHISYTFIAIALLYLGYELLSHPLNRYPGPFFARLTNGYGAFFAVRRSLHLATFKNHLKYGPVVRQGPNKLVFNSVTALRDIYHSENITKPVTYLSNQTTPGSFNTWNALDNGLHSRKRKLSGPAVNDRSMRAFEPTMAKQVDIFIQQLALCQGTPIDMKMRCNYLAMDVVGLLSFGYPLHSQTDSKNRFLADEMARGNRRLNIYMQIPFIPRHRLQIPINLIWYKSREVVFRLIESMIKSRMKADRHATHDLYSFVVDALMTEEGKDLRINDLWMEAILFIVAGGDTTSTAISATFFYLARHRECYKRLSEEIRSTFQSGKDIGGSKLASCQYLRACIDESLRMSPPLPGILWREQCPDKGNNPLIIDGHVVPKGTYVGEYFPDPFTFKPERWLEPQGQEGAPGSRKAMHSAFVPFSIGSRGCAGKAMAYLEMNLTIAKTLWYFDFEPAPGKLGNVGLSDRGEFRLYDIYLSTHDGPWLVFNPRSTLTEDFPELASK
ncbi:cytochrome P450 [Hypoxylon trugodes]|uniref:cytochrome P450 n=1 Tax=Hypoxylon trugodes TaxID=326681 RepID=UPI002192AAB4|nr:cytochrome P450 [Hypoxylon trugodes]KAI1384222.1 cytochrome P450 [Hypoxylon trugodes]